MNIPPIRTNLQSLFIEPTNVKEIKQTITIFKNKKSTGFDMIIVHLLKFIIDKIAQILEYLINLVLVQAFFLKCSN